MSEDVPSARICPYTLGSNPTGCIGRECQIWVRFEVHTPDGEAVDDMAMEGCAHTLAVKFAAQQLGPLHQIAEATNRRVEPVLVGPGHPGFRGT